jgi:capsular polysaccharide biosynthesis protein
MWALDEVGPDCRVLFAPDPGPRLGWPHVRQVLDALGLDDSRVLRPEGPTVFERLWCPVPTIQLSRIYRAADQPHVRAARVLMGSAEPPDRPVYLTRTGLADAMRKPGSEEALEQRLERQGFAIVRPETLDLPAQMALFNGPHPVVGLYGSAMHSVLFRIRPGGQRLAILFPSKVPPRFMMVDAAKGSQAAYLNCLHGEPAIGPDGEPLERQWTIDCDLAMAQLDEAGLLRPH